ASPPYENTNFKSSYRSVPSEHWPGSELSFVHAYLSACYEQPPSATLPSSHHHPGSKRSPRLVLIQSLFRVLQRTAALLPGSACVRRPRTPLCWKPSALLLQTRHRRTSSRYPSGAALVLTHPRHLRGAGHQWNVRTCH